METFETIMKYLTPILSLVFGVLSAYLRTNEMLRQSSIKYIAEAEEIYKDVNKSGGQKFYFVVEALYRLVPPPLRIVITRKFIEQIVQSTFDSIEAYAMTQLDKAIENYILNKS